MEARSVRATLIAALVLGSALVGLAPTAQAVTYANVYLLIRWDGEGCIGSGTGTSISLVARDVWQALGTRTASWPGTSTQTRCKGDSNGGLIQVGPVSLIKYDGYHAYRLEASITDATGTVTSFSSNQAMRVGGSCVGSTFYMGTNDVHCSSTQPASNYLGRANALPATPTIRSLYQDQPDPTTMLYLYWAGPATLPSDFRAWEVHMSTTSGFTPSYSFPSTLKATRTYASNYLSVTGLQPDTQYCFTIRHADRYWNHASFATRGFPSYSDSAERCARTATDALRVTSPNGGEIWSGTHAVLWAGGSPDFLVEVSSDDGASYATLASDVATRSTGWDTRGWPDGASYRVRVGDATTNDTSDALFTVDNTPPVTEASVDGPTCNGWYTAPPLVTLRATDNLAGVKRTLYDAGDGTRPYASPFSIAREGNVTLRYWSEDRADAANVEEAQELPLRIDTSAPETSIRAGAPNWTSDHLYVNSSTDLSLVATDTGSGVVAIEYRIDGGDWTAYSDPFRLAGPDGERLVEFRATDDACHVEAIRSQRVFVDNTAPVIEIVEPAPTQAPTQPPLDPALLCEVAHIAARGLRDNGQPEGAAAVVALLCAQPVAVVTGETTVIANATDPIVNGGASGMARVDFLVDGVARASDATAPWTWTWNASAETPGVHTLSAVAYDHLGASATAELRVLVVGDARNLCDTLLGTLPPQLAFVRDVVELALRESGVSCGLALPPLPEGP